MAAAETWEQIEREMKDLRTRLVTLNYMLACDRQASSRAGNTRVPESHVHRFCRWEQTLRVSQIALTAARARAAAALLGVVLKVLLTLH